MPAGDKTGPTGTGPNTGRGLGYCTKHTHPGFAYSRSGSEKSPDDGRRSGTGRGRRNRFCTSSRDSYNDAARTQATPYHPGRSLHEEWEGLQEDIKRTDEVLKEMKRRISEIEALKEEE
jgi:hypothetical protein